MYDEIDLRQYIRVLISHWRPIVLLALSFSLLSAAVRELLPDKYEATVLLAVSRSRYDLQFDPRFETISDYPISAAIPDIARSDVILSELESQAREDGIILAKELKLVDIMQVTVGSDPSIIELNVNHTLPGNASYLANGWGSLVATTVNRIYGTDTEDQIEILTSQRDIASQELNQMEGNLIDFLANDQRLVLGNELTGLQTLHANLVATRNDANGLLLDIEGFRTSLDSRGDSDRLTAADLATLTLLNLRIFGAPMAEGSTLQLDVTVDQPTMQVDETIAQLEAMADVVEKKVVALDAQMGALIGEILSTQQALERSEAEASSLILQRDVAFETVSTIARKLEESRLSAEVAGPPVSIISAASIPTDAVGGSTILVGLMGFTLGLILAASGFIIREWWRS